MGYGIITVTAELLKEILYLPADMRVLSVRQAGEDASDQFPRDFVLLVGHPDIGITPNGEEYPHIELTYSSEHSEQGDIIRLDDWKVTRGEG